MHIDSKLSTCGPGALAHVPGEDASPKGLDVFPLPQDAKFNGIPANVEVTWSRRALIKA